VMHQSVRSKSPTNLDQTSIIFTARALRRRPVIAAPRASLMIDDRRCVSPHVENRVGEVGDAGSGFRHRPRFLVRTGLVGFPASLIAHLAHLEGARGSSPSSQRARKLEGTGHPISLDANRTKGRVNE